MPAVHPPPGSSTDDLIAYYREASDLPAEALEEAIGKSIDALYTSRDTGRDMHAAGAAAAVAALDAAYGVIFMLGAASARANAAEIAGES